MNDSKQATEPVFTPGIAVFHDKFWSEQWLVICGMCRDDGSAQPFGQDEAAARTWAATHQQAHAELSVTDPSALQRCAVRGYRNEGCIRPALHDGSHEWREPS